MIVGALWFVSNAQIHRDLSFPIFREYAVVLARNRPTNLRPEELTLRRLETRVAQCNIKGKKVEGA